MAKKKPYRFFLYLFARFLAGIVYVIPRRVALFLARGFGKLAFRLVRRQRVKALDNLRRVYGKEKSEAKIEAMGKAVFENLAQTAVDILQFPKFAKKNIDEFIHAGDAFELYRSLLAEGKGFISVTAHIGNWELLAGVFGLKGFDGAVVGRRLYYEPYNRWIVGLRRTLRLRTVYREEAAKELVKLLRAGQIVGLLPDQDVKSLKGIFVPFFDKLAYTTGAPARLAVSNGCPIVVIFLLREKKGFYRIHVAKVLRPDPALERDEAVEVLTREWMQVFEEVIRAYPEQWAWMHNRWKTRPGDVETTQKKVKEMSIL